MKKGRIILSAVALVAAIGSAFAINSTKRFAPANVYTYTSGVGYRITNCYFPDQTTVNCLITSSSKYYYYTAVGGYHQLTNGIQLKNRPLP